MNPPNKRLTNKRFNRGLDSNSNSKINCSYCGNEFIAIHKLKTHIQFYCKFGPSKISGMCNPEYPQPCVFCKVPFISRKMLNNHLIRDCNTDRKFQCHMCGYNSAWDFEFKKHMFTKHPELMEVLHDIQEATASNEGNEEELEYRFEDCPLETENEVDNEEHSVMEYEDPQYELENEENLDNRETDDEGVQMEPEYIENIPDLVDIIDLTDESNEPLILDNNDLGMECLTDITRTVYSETVNLANQNKGILVNEIPTQLKCSTKGYQAGKVCSKKQHKGKSSQSEVKLVKFNKQTNNKDSDSERNRKRNVNRFTSDNDIEGGKRKRKEIKTIPLKEMKMKKFGNGIEPSIRKDLRFGEGKTNVEREDMSTGNEEEDALVPIAIFSLDQV